MAWVKGKRTVYCRRCYQAGHNRRGCPTMTPETKERYAKGDLSRKCSYCRQGGHTKRKCSIRSTDMANYTAENAAYRAEVLSKMESEGLSIGCLVIPTGYTIEQIMKDYRDCLGMITEIDWDSIQLKNKNAKVIEAQSVTGNDRWYFAIRRKDNHNQWDYGYCNLVSSPRKDIREHIPAGWLNGSSGIEKFF